MKENILLWRKLSFPRIKELTCILFEELLASIWDLMVTNVVLLCDVLRSQKNRYLWPSNLQLRLTTHPKTNFILMKDKNISIEFKKGFKISKTNMPGNIVEDIHTWTSWKLWCHMIIFRVNIKHVCFYFR